MEGLGREGAGHRAVLGYMRGLEWEDAYKIPVKDT